jgi:hypothetical protein
MRFLRVLRAWKKSVTARSIRSAAGSENMQDMNIQDVNIQEDTYRGVSVAPASSKDLLSCECIRLRNVCCELLVLLIFARLTASFDDLIILRRCEIDVSSHAVFTHILSLKNQSPPYRSVLRPDLKTCKL